MNNFDFDKIVYNRPWLKAGTRHIEDVIGIDSETLVSGRPFLFALSNGESFSLHDIPKVFFRHKYRGRHFVAYNLKFDAGSLLYNLPLKALNELREKNAVIHDGFHYRYIPHKMLRIRSGKNAVTFWDIFGFYGTSLDKASRKYLGRGKLELETKSFSESYVERHIEKLRKYCIRDATLTRELALFLLKTLNKIGLYPNNLYSTASVSFQYFKQETDIVTVWRFWNERRELLRYACESYYGGKVEITSRGKFTGYEYDINSAYAHEISKLVDVSEAKIKYLRKYDSKALYGYYRVYVHNLTGLAHPVVVKRKNMNIYPSGSFHATITQGELEYLYGHGIEVDVHSGFGLYVSRRRYPYKHVVEKLQHIKEYYKTRDVFVSNIAKLCNNSFYGKMCQVIEDYNGDLVAGIGWNPLYSSVITANVRIKVSRIQEELGDSCLAVHTDAVMTTKPIPEKYVGTKLGDFQLKREGAGVIIMCGMYQHGDKSAYRGFRMPAGFSWYDKLGSMGASSKTRLTFREVKSWVKAVAQNKPEDINRFIDEVKELDLNAENKRLWLGRTNARRLLTELEHSLPIVYNEPYEK